MVSSSSCIAVFKSHSEAENAVKALQESGFDMKKLSIVARDYNTEEHVVGYYNAGDRIKYWGTQGAFWGGLWGLLVGSAFFWVPGIGPLVIAGPIITWIVAALEGAVVIGGLSVVGAGLCSIGIPKNSVIEYEAALSAGKYVLIADGTPAETSRAKEAMREVGPEIAQEHLHQMNGGSADTSASSNTVIEL